MLNKNLEYWQNKLSRVPVLELTTDKLRTSNQEYDIGIETFVFPRQLCESVKTLNQSSENGLFISLLTAFKCLLHKYTAQEDIIVGSCIPQKNNLDFNTLAFRSSISSHICFSELLKQVNQIVIEDFKHQDFSWQQLVEKLSAIGFYKDTSVFQVMFSLQDAFVMDTPLPINVDEFKSDLSLFVVEAREGLKGTFTYNQQLFAPQTIKRMIAHFENLLKIVVENPHTKVGEIAILSEIERYQILVEWNNTELDYPHDKCIHQLFEEQVAKTPDAVAVIFQEQQLTYQQLDNRANQLANYLQTLGIKPDTKVGICINRCLNMVVGILGILKAGAAYIPIDPNYPQERLSHMLDDSDVSVLLTTENLLSGLPANKAKQICLDRDWESLISHQSQESPTSDVKPSHLAYIIYTSGSTGKSKGVMIEHSSLVNFTITATKEYAINHRDRVLQFASISFDVAVEEIYPCLTNGATLILRTDEFLTNGHQMLQKCEQWGITVLDLPTAYWHQLVSDLATAESEAPQNLRLVIIGGEAVIPEKVRTWQKSFKNNQYPELINTYGPTEATVVVTRCKLSESINKDTGLAQMTIGKPFANVQIYILDSCLNPVPIGVPGELHIGGLCLARGYLNRPELTAQKFIPDPFNRGMRMYKSGDLARFLPDGNIDFLGRIDHQVKIRGFRIELGEIETVLNQHAAVKQAIVIPQEYEAGDKRLIAYIVPRSTQSPTNKQLKEFLKSRLPEYMIPSGFVSLEALPLTPNDKVDRKALPKPDKNNLNLEEEYLSARNDVEKKLVTLWEQAFRIQPIGIKDNFFSLGGNSLMATSMVAEIEKIFDKKLNQGVFFEASTIEQLAAILLQEEIATESVIKINFSGNKLPLFIIANNGFLYQQMIENLDTEQPVYIVQEPLDKASEMASRCIRKIRDIQPQGPYNLMGHSYEGLVTYEIAQQLYLQNEQIAFLGMLDTPTPEVENRAEEARLLFKRYQRLKAVLGFSWKDKTSFFKERVEYKLSESFKPLMPTLSKFMNEYKLKALPIKLNIFVAIFEFYGLEDANFGWDKWAKEVETHKIPGTHRSMLLKPENAQLLANKISICLTK
ncbi:amino acid adenylation enzyme/thioester reductase family protein [Rivularia sp. PCC 7116]|uniref:non-ribosomal peptide synthetase n=1 Tax=Rivularia sp. PCC 7116 TaxID=373994 RepID=UPI00029ECE60|nr:non-ribosomal peptide synthetase [Rivularia sp. PCC 7116]AFY59073.1 amino acid adenylation enzyme/thioester reductase family protein [Rivularia sp. PCC 7116]